VIRTAIKFAVFGVICLLLTTWLAFVIGNREFSDPLDRDAFGLTARFDDVTGLLPNDEVKIAGVEVGKVTGVTTDNGRALVHFKVDNSYKDQLPIDTTASIRWRNLIGQRFLYLIPGTASTNLQPGDEVCKEFGCDTDSVANLGDLFNKLGPIVASLDEGKVNEFLESVTQALQGNTDNLGNILHDLGTVSSGLASRDAAIQSLIDDFNTVAGTVATRDQQIRTLIDNLAVLAQTFSDNTNVVDQALNEFASFSTDLATLVDNNRQQIDDIIANLDDTVATEVRPRLTAIQGALDGIDEFSRAVFNAGRNGEWLNQDILCADVKPPPAGQACAVPVNLIPSILQSLGIGASAPDFQTGVDNVVNLFGAGGPR
jgi:phospholipid/cholesterol/gamma-HCH transport system substrate-binding protein